MATAPSAVLADVVVGISFFGLGLVAYLAGTNIIAATHTQGHRRLLHLAYFTARVGFIIMVGLITEAVFRAGAVRPEWRSWTYIVAGLMVGIGYLGVAVETRKVNGG